MIVGWQAITDTTLACGVVFAAVVLAAISLARLKNRPGWFEEACQMGAVVASGLALVFGVILFLDGLRTAATLGMMTILGAVVSLVSVGILYYRNGLK